MLAPMRLHRFYTDRDLPKNLIYTQENHIHQWYHVFRYVAGDTLILFGDGYEHTYEIVSLSKKTAELREVNTQPSKMQPAQHYLALALIKKDNFELALQKCTEIGVTNFMPIISERSEQQMYSKDRLLKILIEATEQSGWGRVPTLTDPITFDTLLLQNERKILFHTSGIPYIYTKKDGASIVIIGPEGGWTDTELETAHRSGVEVYNLPLGILRAETAAIVCSALISL